MELPTNSSPASPGDNTPSTPWRSGVEESLLERVMKRKVEEEAGVTKVARVMEGEAGVTGLPTEGELKDRLLIEGVENAISRYGVKMSVDDIEEVKSKEMELKDREETGEKVENDAEYKYRSLEIKLQRSEDEKEQMKHELKKVTQNMQKYENQSKKIQEKNTLEMENYKKVVVKLQEKIECPVCLEVPREGPMPCCPVGHLTCSPCLERLGTQARQGRVECPTCREPMGEGRSSLARIVIENMAHQCSFEGCEEMVHYNDYGQHQAVCRFRRVVCPGDCDLLMAFCEVKKHAATCQEVSRGFGVKTLTQEEKQDTDVKWVSEMFSDVNGATFFLQTNKEDNIFSMDVVMLGSKDECKELSAEVSIANPDTKNVFHRTTFSPRPISVSNNPRDSSLVVRQSTIARYWNYNQKTKNYEFTVTAKVHRVTA